MNKFDDPRQFPTRLEWPTTFEGAKEFPMWDIKMLDLDELPVEEYMKPMPVNVVSGGTGPGPEPTPSGETTYYSVKFIASGTTYGNYQIESGKTVPSSYVPAPTKDGYTFSGWTPNPATTVITAATNFNGWFIENEADMVYYTTIMVPSGSEFTEVGLEECELTEFADGKSIRFEIPLSEEYAEMVEKHEDEQITEEEWEEFLETWLATQLYVVRLVLPKNKTLDNITVTDAAHSPVDVTGPTSVVVDGKELNCFSIENQYFTPTEEDQFFKLTITIK